ncbi:MAG: hypothetical protein ABIW94_10885, partial [Gemmatimonadaceae bacterium]
MRARSAWLSHPKFKATWVAIAAGSLAGLAVLGACSDAPVSKIAGPGPSIDAPRFGVVGGLAHLIKVCVDQTSTPGTYNFGITADPTRILELPTITDPPSIYQTFFGPYVPGDAVATSASIVLPVGALVPVCATIFARDDTPLHVNNRILTLPVIGVVNPYATFSVLLGSLPAGSTFTAQCSNDDPNLPQTAGCVAGPITANPIFSSANVFHGSTITYTITAQPQIGPCVLPNVVFGLGAANAFTLLGLSGNKFDIGTSGTLIRGDVGFGPLNTGNAKKATIDGNLTKDPT